MSPPKEEGGPARSRPPHYLNAPSHKLEIWSRLDPSIIEADRIFRSHIIDADCDQSRIIRAFPDFSMDWFSPQTAVICKAAGNLKYESIPVNIISITDELRKSGKLDEIGGAGAIGAPDAFLSWSDVKAALDKLREAYQRREARKGLESSLHAVDHGPLEAIQQAKEALDCIGNTHGNLPAIVDAMTLVENPPPKPDDIIEGILHMYGKLVLGGGSKSFKTWALVDMALSVATGSDFWGHQCKKGRVLFVNFEIQAPFFASRLLEIAHARGIKLKAGELDVFNLRGHSADATTLLPKISSSAGKEAYSLIILDPLYKLLGNRDENASRDMADLMNAIERLTVDTGAAVAFGSHFAKGNASGKESMDRISGSGVFARDPDSIITMTRHEVDEAFTVEMTLRNHPPQDSFVVRREHPLMVRDEALDPDKLKQAVGRSAVHTEQDALDLLTGEMTSTEWQVACATSRSMSRATFFRLRSRLEKDGKVFHSRIDQKWSRKS